MRVNYSTGVSFSKARRVYRTGRKRDSHTLQGLHQAGSKGSWIASFYLQNASERFEDFTATLSDSPTPLDSLKVEPKPSSMLEKRSLTELQTLPVPSPAL